jgi:hypothetical protein
MLEPCSQADLFKHFFCSLKRLVTFTSSDEKRHRHVLYGGELVQQVVELVDEAERRVPHRAALGLAHRAEGAAAHVDCATARRIEPAEQMQQRRLARARAPHDGDVLPGPDLEVDAVQHWNRLRSLVRFF